MIKSYYNSYIKSVNQVLSQLLITDRNGKQIEQGDSFARLCDYSSSIQSNCLTQFFCGNGASSSIADHMALDWTKNGKVKSMSFGSSAILSAVSNDLGADHFFSAPLSWHAKSGDLLVAVSSSGNSENIIKAVEYAIQNEMKVVTFSGLRPDNKLRSMGDINLYTKAHTYGIVECAHQILLHTWLDQFMQVEEWSIEDFQNMRQNHLN